MKANVTEDNMGFHVELEPENVNEAAVLVRLGMQSKKDVDFETDAYLSSGFSTYITFTKRNTANSTIPKQK